MFEIPHLLRLEVYNTPFFRPKKYNDIKQKGSFVIIEIKNMFLFITLCNPLQNKPLIGWVTWAH